MLIFVSEKNRPLLLANGVCYKYICIYIYMDDYLFRKMRFFHVMMALRELSLFMPITTGNLDDDTYFTSTGKDLQCHEIQTFNVRSAIECCLHCKEKLYSCAGYVHTRNKARRRFSCEICLIYDVSTPMVTVNRTNSTAVGMPNINKEEGKAQNELGIMYLPQSRMQCPDSMYIYMSSYWDRKSHC